MAYITRFNFNRVFRNIADSVELVADSAIYPGNPDVDKFCDYFFNKHEKNDLIKFKEFVRDPDLYIEHYFTKTKEINSYKFLNLDGKTPAYHIDLNCKAMHNDFVGLLIPQNIADRGREEIERFKQFYRENEDLYIHDREAFEFRASIKFETKIKIEEDNRPNSGIQDFNNLKIEELKEFIINLWEDLKAWIIEDGMNSDRVKVYRHFHKVTYFAESSIIPADYNRYGLSDKRILEILKTIHFNYKKPMIELLKKYYMISINPEIKLEGYLLNNLGFTPCRHCCKESHLMPKDTPDDLR